MNLIRLNFEFDGHQVSVTGYHDRGFPAGHDDPGSPERFGVMTVAITRQADPAYPVEASSLDHEELEDAALHAWHAREEVERGQYFDMIREERRLTAVHA